MGKRVLVTGGAGYVGSQTAIVLRDAGFEPVILDNLANGHREPLEALGFTVIIGDISDTRKLDSIFGHHSFDAVVHFAAYAYVGESVQQPAKYYRNNVAATLDLLEAMVRAGVSRIVFSSSCSTYGIPDRLPIDESAPQRPVSPYGFSKMVVERILRDFERAYGMRHVIFRYFNAAGADAKGRVGENHDPETHLIPLALYAASGLRPMVRIFGDDYPTPDGSCIRDYVHVEDLAEGHVLGLRHLMDGGDSAVFNIGNGRGVSVFEVIECARRVTGRPIAVEVAPRRAGDPAALYADATRARQILGWKARFPGIEEMVEHAWAWQQGPLFRSRMRS